MLLKINVHTRTPILTAIVRGDIVCNLDHVHNSFNIYLKYIKIKYKIKIHS